MPATYVDEADSSNHVLGQPMQVEAGTNVSGEPVSYAVFTLESV